jgi:prepilin-type N-terminal cleavage/methylation domain-containing protein
MLLATPLSPSSVLRSQSSTFSPPRKASGFTLIELLVVIVIIAILAGLAFPAVQGALESGKKAQARNDVHQLAAAVKAFQLEYGRLPVDASGGTDTTNAPNSDIISALTKTNQLNPRGIMFFEPKIARRGRGGLDGTVYKDPWGNPYTFMLDTSYDNRIVALGQTNFTTVVVTSPGGTNSAETNVSRIISNVR